MSITIVEVYAWSVRGAARELDVIQEAFAYGLLCLSMH